MFHVVMMRSPHELGTYIIARRVVPMHVIISGYLTIGPLARELGGFDGEHVHTIHRCQMV